MTNHAIIALERVRDELSDDRRGLPRVTRSYQRPAPRSVTPHHSRRHAARLLGANRNQRNSSVPSLSSPRPEELAQTKSKSKFFAYTVSKSWKHGVRAPQQGASGLLESHARAADEGLTELLREQQEHERQSCNHVAESPRRVTGNGQRRSRLCASCCARALACSLRSTSLLLHLPEFRVACSRSPRRFGGQQPVMARASQRAECVRSENARRGTERGS